LLNIKKFKKLFLKSKKNPSGRNKNGRITIRHKGSGIFGFCRNVDYYRTYKNDLNNFVGYDFNKKSTTPLALIKYHNGNISYILAPDNILENQNITTTFFFNKLLGGYSLPLGWIPNNSIIHNLELKPNFGGTYIRSAGTFGKIISHNNDDVLVQLPSKKKQYFSKYCMATIGRCSNNLHFFENYGNAGYSRRNNIRPTVRGETMNPIDHPMGGRTRGGKPTKNPWGKIIK
jgi:large subunit ribosomal protein L2